MVEESDGRMQSSEPSPYISRLRMGMKNSMAVIGAQPSDDQVERWAAFIYESMSNSSRSYHGVKHVFDLSQDQKDPILVLSAFFHDCIYIQVDGGLTPDQALLVGDVIQDKDSTIYLNPGTTSDFLLSMVEAIFGFSPGQSVGLSKGLNEFLSAMVAVRLLEPVLDKTILAQIACCIEATIPFRPPDKEGITAMEHLHDRMVTTNECFHLGLSQEQLVEAVQRAVRLANVDIAGFGTTDRARFLDDDWSLLPETNKSLQSPNLYTVHDYQHAIFKMNGLFSSLNPSHIFSCFRGIPTAQEYNRWTSEATHNIDIGRTYVRAKLLSASFLAALATLTGGDAPISLFLGDLSVRQDTFRRLLSKLPSVQCGNDTVYEILLHGRKQETAFDIRQSPLAAYLYACMGSETVNKLVQESVLYPMGTKEAKDLLSRLPRKVVRQIAENMASVVVTRADAIRAVLEDLPPDSNDDEDYLNGT